MRIRVLLFGPEAEAVGRDAVEIDVRGERPDARAILDRLAAEHPPLAPRLGAARIAVNHEFVPPDRPVLPGDEVALIGLVSGG